MKKTNTNYVSTTLDQFLNESRNITLTRKYGKNEPVVVSSKAPIRNKVLQYVAENQKVTKNSLKKFIVSLNENNSNPSSISMWMKRNEQYFLYETKNGVTTYKLSNLGKKLVSNIALNEGCNCGNNVIKKPTSTTKVKKRVFENEDVKKEEEWPDDKQRTHDFEDHGEKGIYDEQNEDTYEGAKRVIESIKARRVFEAVEEEEEEEVEDDETEEVEDAETEEVEDDETEEVEDDETEEVEDFETEDEEDFEDDDKVEITEFVLSVDDAESAIAELAELGITAERVTSEDEELPAEDEELPAEDEELPAEDDEFGTPAEDEELPAEDDFDLGDLGDIEGEDDVVESVNEDDETPAEDDEFGTPAEDDEFGTPAEDEELPVEDDEFGVEDDEFGTPAEDEELPVEDDEFGAPEFDNNQIKVSAENWDVLKGWLESKGVDTKELFGGDIVEEGEEGEEDDNIEEEIDFDSLENLEEYEDDKDTSTKKEGKPKESKEDEESEEDEEDEPEETDKKDGKKWNFEK